MFVQRKRQRIPIVLTRFHMIVSLICPHYPPGTFSDSLMYTRWQSGKFDCTFDLTPNSCFECNAHLEHSNFIQMCQVLYILSEC